MINFNQSLLHSLGLNVSCYLIYYLAYVGMPFVNGPVNDAGCCKLFRITVQKAKNKSRSKVPSGHVWLLATGRRAQTWRPGIML